MSASVPRARLRSRRRAPASRPTPGPRRVLPQQAAHEIRKGRCARRLRRRRRRRNGEVGLVVEDHLHQLGERRRDERRRARGTRTARTRRPRVRRTVHAVSAEQFGSHVARRASLRQRGGARRRRRAARGRRVGTAASVAAVAVDDRLYVGDPPRQTNPHSFSRPSSSMSTLDGFRSQCSTPASCATRKAETRSARSARCSSGRRSSCFRRPVSRRRRSTQNQPQVVRGFVPGVSPSTSGESVAHTYAHNTRGRWLLSTLLIA